MEEVAVALANLAGIVVIVLSRSSVRFKEQIGMAGLGKPRSHKTFEESFDPQAKRFPLSETFLEVKPRRWLEEVSLIWVFALIGVWVEAGFLIVGG